MALRRAAWCAAALALGACASPGTPTADGAPAPAAAVPPVTFTGTRWMGVVDEPPDPRSTPRIEFIGEGRMSGYTGCNMFSGDWSMQGATVVIGKMAMTKRLCMGPPRDVEKRFVAALHEGSRGTRTGDKLVFVAPDGERFEFREAGAG
jgi:heat shock protein HslJ